MRRVRRRASARAAAAAMLLAACTGGSGDRTVARDETRVVVETRPGGALRLRVQGADVTTLASSGEWLAWGSSPVSPRDVKDPHVLVIFNVRTGEQRTEPAARERGIVTAFRGTQGRFVVRELEFERGSACADRGTRGCATWRLWSFDPATGSRADLARSDQARSQDANPVPVAGPDWVAWQESRADGAHLRVLHDGAAEPTTVHRSAKRSSNLAANRRDLVFDDPDRRGRLLRVAGARGHAERLLAAPTVVMPAAGDTFVSWLGGRGEAPTRLFAAAASRPDDVTEVARSERIYWQLGSRDRLLYGGAHGVMLVESVARRTRPRPLANESDHQVGYAFGDDGRLFYGVFSDVDDPDTVIVAE